MASRWYSVVIDAIDPPRLGRWWAEVLDFKVFHESEQECVITADPPAHPGLVFVRVPEAKSVKNRLHFDINPDDQASEVERLVNMGARHVVVGQGDKPWVVLADPEGNEFCVMAAREQQ